MQERLIRIKEVMNRTGLGRSTVWLKVKDENTIENEVEFPKPIKLSPRITVWKESDVNNYIKEVIKSNQK